MKHFKYPSINNLTEKDIIELRSKNTILHVSEKLHGANFSVCIDKENNIFACSRNQVLKDEDSFFGYKEVLDKYNDILLFVKEYLNKDDIRIFGELAGDNIQNNANYGGVDFYIFDVFVDFERLDQIKYAYLLNAIRKKFNDDIIKVAPTIGLKNIDEVIEHGNKFDNLINGKSICEGLILKSLEDNNIIFKYKNDLFSEIKIDITKIKKYHSYNTDNRARGVVSKNGDFNKSNMGLYIKQIKEDIEKDMKIDGLEVDFDGKENKYISNIIMSVYFK